MDKYKRYYGIFILVASVAILAYASTMIVAPKIEELNSTAEKIVRNQKTLEDKQNSLKIVKEKIKKIQNSIANSQKDIYSPTESDLGNDGLFFNLYNDIIEMLHANSVKIKSISYTYNPAEDKFVGFGKDVYFVCDVNIDTASDFVSLGKLVQDIYQYPYYIKINKIDIKPYERNKKILLSNISLRLYAHTSPKDIVSGN